MAAAFRHLIGRVRMWRRRFSGGWGRGLRTRRSGLGYGGAVLLVSGAILLVLYLTGRLSL